MSDGPNPNLVQTGDFKETTWNHRGPFFPDRMKPNACVCCGSLYYFENGYTCPCPYIGTWIQDHLDRITCSVHLEQKMRDGKFGALEGNFTIPSGPARQRETGMAEFKPAHKRPDKRATAPIVHR